MTGFEMNGAVASVDNWNVVACPSRVYRGSGRRGRETGVSRQILSLLLNTKALLIITHWVVLWDGI